MFNGIISKGQMSANEAVVSILKQFGNHKKWAENWHSFEDAKRTIVVDMNTGNVYHMENNKLTQYASGIESAKKNGYIYADVFTQDCTGKVSINVVPGQHNIVMILKDQKTIEDAIKYGKVLEPCHINNIGWDNRPANLEWGTHAQNMRHSKLVSSIEHYYPGIYTRIITKKIIKNNDIINYDYVMCRPLYNHMIDEYLKINPKGLSISKHNEYLAEKQVNNFIDWMTSKNYW